MKAGPAIPFNIMTLNAKVQEKSTPYIKKVVFGKFYPDTIFLPIIIRYDI